jgi:hypothetical protein
LPVTSFGLAPDADQIARSADAGIDRVVFGLPPEKADTVLPLLDQYAEMAARHPE